MSQCVAVQEALGPKLAVLCEQCLRLGLNSNQAETLMMLIEDATVPQVLDTLQKYTENFDAVSSMQCLCLGREDPVFCACLRSGMAQASD